MILMSYREAVAPKSGRSRRGRRRAASRWLGLTISCFASLVVVLVWMSLSGLF
jgi:hypothetical protein